MHIAASPRGGRSFSGRAAEAFLEEYFRLHPEDSLDTLELAATDLPEFDDLAARCLEKRRRGEQLEGRLAARWISIEAVIRRFTAADKLVISCPMWNFSVPYRLKHYIDLIVQAGYTFTFEGGRQRGLVEDCPAVLFLARGSSYGAGSGLEELEFQQSYLEAVLKFIGCKDVTAHVVEPTGRKGPEVAQKALDDVIRRARAAAADF